MPTLQELRAAKARLEAEQEELRQQLTEAEEQTAEARVALRSGRASPEAIRRQEEGVVELRREIQRHKIALSELAGLIEAAEAAAEDNLVHEVRRKNEAVKGELQLVRREVLRSLIGMAELLRRHKKLAEEKSRLGADLAHLTGEDQAYDNYISTALLHAQDYIGDVQFVVDTIRKSRAVS